MNNLQQLYRFEVTFVSGSQLNVVGVNDDHAKLILVNLGGTHITPGKLDMIIDSIEQKEQIHALGFWTHSGALYTNGSYCNNDEEKQNGEIH